MGSSTHVQRPEIRSATKKYSRKNERNRIYWKNFTCRCRSIQGKNWNTVTSTFTLGEYFAPIQTLFSNDVDYREQLTKMRESNIGYPGIQGRCANILGEEFTISSIDRNLIRGRLAKSLANFPESNIIASGNYNSALDSLTNQFAAAQTFTERMRKLWIIRDLIWMSSGNNEEIFIKLAGTLTDMRDGDLIRTT